MDRKVFRTLFIIYLVCVAALWSCLIYAYRELWFPQDRNVFTLSMMMFAAAMGLFLVFLLIGIGRFVYADAKTRQMDPTVWTLVAVFVPYFIGLVAYLVVRKPLAETCRVCGRPVLETQAFCPFCGNQVRVQCPNCQTVADSSFSFCPKCGTPLQTAKSPGSV